MKKSILIMAALFLVASSTPGSVSMAAEKSAKKAPARRCLVPRQLRPGELIAPRRCLVPRQLRGADELARFFLGLRRSSSPCSQCVLRALAELACLLNWLNSLNWCNWPVC